MSAHMYVYKAPSPMGLTIFLLHSMKNMNSSWIVNIITVADKEPLMHNLRTPLICQWHRKSIGGHLYILKFRIFACVAQAIENNNNNLAGN